MMNREDVVVKRSLALHRAVVQQLREDPSLWAIPLQNIQRWTEQSGRIEPVYEVWKDILTSWPQEKIVKLLLSRSQRAALLRSSSPFTGIISADQRNRIFERYRRQTRDTVG